jgi:threonine/homoserine/homoserine lactone efflux protein
MAIELWLAFVVASTIMLLIPGPTILTVIAYASSHGRTATLPLVVAVSLGDMAVITLSVFGLGRLLAISSSAFTAVKS